MIGVQLIAMTQRINASLLLEYISSNYQEEIKDLLEIELSLVNAASELLSLCKSKDKLTLSIDKNELVIKISIDKFGVSLLNVMCDNYEETILKNALLFHLVSVTTSRKGRIEIKHIDSIMSLLITNPLQSN